MRKLTPADYRVMPWKNGGGETTELYLEPDPDGPGFLWRVSIATVAVDGPFSLFEGYDRHIMTIEGNGIMLNGGPAGPIEVNPKFRPCYFSGDWPITSSLIDGPVRDFNLITRLGRCDGGLYFREATGSLELTGIGSYFIYLLEGELAIATPQSAFRLSAGESLLLEPTEHATLANKANDPSRIALAGLFIRD